MERHSIPTLSADELISATGEPIERLQRFRSLGLIGPEDGERYASRDVERVRLIQFLERRQIPLEAIARREREESVLTSVVDFLYSRDVGRRYSFAQATEVVGLDPDVARRLREASAPMDEVMDEHDVRMLQGAKVALGPVRPKVSRQLSCGWPSSSWTSRVTRRSPR